MIATVTHLYGIAGATPAEAACLAPITGRGAHAVNQAFDQVSDAQTRAAIECVGSEARLREIAGALGEYIAEHRFG